jgi:diaminohydroxyphosphoribosylaminopyrimidine deaminase/5-amino-6-(5-phosphoribosylamino)uracil reductase
MKEKEGRGRREEMDDLKFMKIALKLSRRGVGRTEPNPLVGALAVKDGRILSSGFHRAFGDRHAETMALEHMTVPGATLYLTLEPCSHFGKTPPCVDLIIAKKVRRVVMAMEDPNPLVNGSGIRKLQEHGIETLVGLCRDQAEQVNRHYLKAMRSGLPYVAIHAGLSLDGKLTDRFGHSRWITSEEARRYAHSLRGEFSAILAGRNTILADDPRLTLREAGWEGKKLFRVVLDSSNSLPHYLNIFKDQENFPLVLFSSRAAAERKKKVPRHFFVSSDEHGLVLPELLGELANLGIASVLVEGGGRLIDSFIRGRLFDEMILFFSRKVVGGRDSVQMFASGVADLQEALELTDCRWSEFAAGQVMRGYRKCSPA